jgi:hypothetical protein
MEVENWLPVKGYEGHYEVSDLGRVRSLKWGKCRILSENTNSVGYSIIKLCKEGKYKSKGVHQIVAMSFLNHNPNGHNFVVNHIDFNKTNNRLTNLEIISNRDNSNLLHKKFTSPYLGVSWDKRENKWVSSIYINGKTKWLGYFDNEIDASKKYLEELNKFNNESQFR